MLHKKLFGFVIALLMLLPAAGNSLAQDEPLVVGLMVDQATGLSIYSTELENGFKLGLIYSAGLDPADYDNDVEAALADVEIAGRPVEIIVSDYMGDADAAASQARELIEVDGVEILVGAPSSGVTLGLQQVAADTEVLLFVAPGASPAITGENFNDNTFRVCRNTFQDSLALASFSTELGEEWIILAADYDFGRSSAEAFEATLGSQGVEFPGDVIYAPLETSDFTPYLQEVLASGADALLPIWAGDTAVALYQQIDELGVDDELTVVGAFNSNDVVAASSTDANIGNVSWIVYHYTFPDNPINDWLLENHLAAYDDYPDLFTECSFATAQAMYQSVDAADGNTLPEDLRPELEGLAFDGPKGTYYIRPSDHQALVPMYVAELANYDSPEQDFYTLLGEVSALESAPPCLLTGDNAERCEMDAEFMEMVAEMEGGDMEEEMDAEATEESEE
jgi:branched-chain amino acid transport system substrate-binding protein